MDDTTALQVRAEWDARALAWVATSSGIPGLTAVAASLDHLVEKLRDVIDELDQVKERRQGQKSNRSVVLITSIPAR